MANIDIQRKERSIWPWIAGLLVLVLVIWGVAEMMDDDTATVATGETYEETPPAAGTPDAAAQPAGETDGARFGSWVRDSAEALDRMAREHEYTREGIRRLAAALASLVQRENAPQAQQRLETMRQQAQAIEQSDVTSTDHAGQARQAFTTAVDVLDELRQQPHLQDAQLQSHVEQAREAANAVAAGTPLLQQRAQVHAFFDRMAEAIRVAEQHQTQRR